jgi:hypothetical protein
MRSRLVVSLLLSAFLAVTLACSGKKSPTTATPTVTVTSVQVGISGGASATPMPGETRQLFAVAAQSDGTTMDVTNLATWQSSNPAAATVSPSGLVSAAAEGAVDVSATYKSVKGSAHVDVKPSCTVSISPASASFNAFGGSGTVTVSVNSASCGWSAHSDAAWFPFSAASAAGSGSFTYALPPNSTVAARTAKVIVETTNGASATHSIAEDKPLGCSYVTQPEEVTFSASGGTGQFAVIATPDDCHWNLINGLSQLGVSVTSGFSGTGSGTVRYSVQAHTRSVDADGYLEIAGLSGLNPNGRHHIIILKR